MHRLLWSAITVGALSVGPLGASAHASDGFGVVRVDVTSTYTSFSLTSTPTCDAANRCLVGYTATAEMSGGMRGTLVNDGTLWLESGFSAYQATVIGLFTGTVDGCGTGTMALAEPLTAGGSAPFSGRSEVVAGSGTGGLAMVSGSGRYVFDSGTSEGTFELKCRAS